MRFQSPIESFDGCGRLGQRGYRQWGRGRNGISGFRLHPVIPVYRTSQTGGSNGRVKTIRPILEVYAEGLVVGVNTGGLLGGTGSLDLFGIQGLLQPAVGDFHLLLVLVRAVQE